MKNLLFWLFSRVNSKPTNKRSSFCFDFDFNWEFGGNFIKISLQVMKELRAHASQRHGIKDDNIDSCFILCCSGCTVKFEMDGEIRDWDDHMHDAPCKRGRNKRSRWLFTSVFHGCLDFLLYQCWIGHQCLITLPKWDKFRLLIGYLVPVIRDWRYFEIPDFCSMILDSRSWDQLSRK